MTAGKRLVALRKASDLTQAQVAEAINVDLKTLRRYEQNKSSPNLETIAALAQFYKVSADDIVLGFTPDTLSRISSSIRNRSMKAYCELFESVCGNSVGCICTGRFGLALFPNAITALLRRRWK